MIETPPTIWTHEPPHLRAFNGVRFTTKTRTREMGLFREPHTIAGCHWSARTRPLDQDGNPYDCWGCPILLGRTLADLRASAERWLEDRARADD